MKEYHKAIENYRTALQHDPENAEAMEGLQKTQFAISQGAVGEADEERVRHAMADPEIRVCLVNHNIYRLVL